MAMLDSQEHPWSLQLINNVEYIVVFPGLKVFNDDNSYKFSRKRNNQLKIIYIDI